MREHRPTTLDMQSSRPPSDGTRWQGIQGPRRSSHLEELAVAAVVQGVEERPHVRDAVDNGEHLGCVDHLRLELRARQRDHRGDDGVEDALLVAEQLRPAFQAAKMPSEPREGL